MLNAKRFMAAFGDAAAGGTDGSVTAEMIRGDAAGDADSTDAGTASDGGGSGQAVHGQTGGDQDMGAADDAGRDGSAGDTASAEVGGADSARADAAPAKRARKKSTRFSTLAHCLLGGSQARDFASRLAAPLRARVD